MRRAHPAAPATPLARRFAPFLLLILAALTAPSVAAASQDLPTPRPADEPVPARTLSGVAVEGTDRAVVRLPVPEADPGPEPDTGNEPAAGGDAEAEGNDQPSPGLSSYVNTGYSVRLGDRSTAGEGMAVVEVDLAPLESAAPFQLPALEEGAEPPDVAVLAREITAKSATLYGAVSSVLGWVVHNVVTDETAALVPTTPAAEEGEKGGEGEAEPLSQEPAAVIARGSGDAGGIARLTVELLRAVGIEARTVRGRVVGKPEVGGPWGPHTWVEVRYPDAGWVFSDPLHHHHYVPATYLRLPPLPAEAAMKEAAKKEMTESPAGESAMSESPPEAGEKDSTTVDTATTPGLRTADAGDGAGGDVPGAQPQPPAPVSPYELVERLDGRQTVDLYPLGGPGVTARRNRAVQRAAALRVVVAGPRRGSAVLEGAGGRTSKILIDGESVFVGLATGSYRLEVYLEDEAPNVRQPELGPRERRAIFLRRDAEAEAAERRKPAGSGARDLPPPDHYRARQPTASRNSP